MSSITYPGAPGVGHQWAYLPDVAETMARLVEAEPAEAFATYHMAGHWDADGTQMIEAIRAPPGNPGPAGPPLSLAAGAARLSRWCRCFANSSKCARSGSGRSA